MALARYFNLKWKILRLKQGYLLVILKGVKFYLSFSEFNFEKLIQNLLVSRSICHHWHKLFSYAMFQILNSKFTKATPGLIWCDLHHFPNTYEIFQIGWALDVSIAELRTQTSFFSKENLVVLKHHSLYNVAIFF